MENLSSILQNGIISAEDIETSQTVHGVRLDPNRFDRNTSATCFSVQEPNLDHLERILERYDKAAVLVISTDIILSALCAFYPQNAARKKYRYKSLSHWQRSDRLEEFFDEPDKRFFDDGSPLPANFPTYLDAEIHIFGKIDMSYIEQIAIQSLADRAKFERVFPKFEFIEFRPGWPTKQN